MRQPDTTLSDPLPSPPPLLRVVSGDPSDDELAALVAVVATAATGPRSSVEGVATPASRSAWRNRAQLLRRPHFAGPGAWRASSWTR